MWEYTQTPSSDELYHYGVLGMRWGIRKGRKTDVYAKASKKLAKLDEGLGKSREKASKALNKSAKKETSWLASQKSKDKALSKAKKAQAKVIKRVYKANKWYKSMETELGKAGIKMSKDQVALGKQYAEALERNGELNYYTR